MIQFISAILGQIGVKALVPIVKSIARRVLIKCTPLLVHKLKYWLAKKNIYLPDQIPPEIIDIIDNGLSFSTYEGEEIRIPLVDFEGSSLSDLMHKYQILDTSELKKLIKLKKNNTGLFSLLSKNGKAKEDIAFYINDVFPKMQEGWNELMDDDESLNFYDYLKIVYGEKDRILKDRKKEKNIPKFAKAKRAEEVVKKIVFDVGVSDDVVDSAILESKIIEMTAKDAINKSLNKAEQFKSKIKVVKQQLENITGSNEVKGNADDALNNLNQLKEHYQTHLTEKSSAKQVLKWIKSKNEQIARNGRQSGTKGHR